MKIGQALLGIRIDAGDHEIVLDYEPVGLRPAAIVSGITWVALALGLLIARRRKKNFYAVAATPRPIRIEETPAPEPESDETGFAFIEEIPDDPAES